MRLSKILPKLERALFSEEQRHVLCEKRVFRDWDTTSAEDVAAVIRAHGFCVVRDAVPDGILETLHEGAEIFLDRVASCDPDEVLPNTVLYSRTNQSFPLEMISKALSRDDWSILRALEDTPVLDIMRAFFNSSAVLLRSPNMRLQNPDFTMSHVPWHQDGFNLRQSFNVLNCWTPVSPEGIGREAPGLALQYHRPRLKSVLPLEASPESPNYGFLEPDRSHLGSLHRSSTIIRPEMDPGDVIIFDKFVMHRTNFASGMTEPRISAELRFLPDEPDIRAFLDETPIIPYYPFPGDVN